jgi:putative transposon-encoded protein
MDKKTKEQNNDDKGDFNYMKIFKHPIEFEGVEEILKREVSRLGNSGHISIPSKHIGKSATITIWKKEEETKE